MSEYKFVVRETYDGKFYMITHQDSNKCWLLDYQIDGAMVAFIFHNHRDVLLDAIKACPDYIARRFPQYEKYIMLMGDK